MGLTGLGATLASLHPLVALGTKLAATFLMLPLVTTMARMVLGATRDAQFRESHAAAKAIALGIGAGGAAFAVGFDALDPRLVGAGAAASFAARAVVGTAFSVLGSMPALLELRRNRPWRALDASERGAFAVALVVAMLPGLAIVAVRANVALGDDPLAREAVGNPGVRAYLVPSDGAAHLALASMAAATDEKNLARREIALARGLGAEEADVLEIESELAARGGDCRAATDLFHRALRERVPTDPSEHLDLGGFHLPPSLVARCDLASGTAR